MDTMIIQKPKRQLSKKKAYNRKKFFRKARREGERLLQSFDDGSDNKNDNNIRKQIETEWPSSKAFGNLLQDYNLIADSTFTKDKTGVGEIEYFNEPEIIYPNGYIKRNPSNGPSLVYNPDSQTIEDIKLDLLHHYRAYDPVYQDLLNDYEKTQDFGNILYNSELGEYFRNLPKEQQTDENWRSLVKENLDSQYTVQGIDGSLRGLIAPDKLRKIGRYPDRRIYEEENLNTPAAKKAYQNIVDYLTSKRLPEVIVKPQKKPKDKFDIGSEDNQKKDVNKVPITKDTLIKYGTPEQIADPNQLWEYPKELDDVVVTPKGSYPNMQAYIAATHGSGYDQNAPFEMFNALTFNAVPILLDTAYQGATGQYGRQDADTPIQNAMGTLYKYTAPSRWLGSVKSMLPGYKLVSPWSDNNPGLTGNPNLDGVFDALAGSNN